ncbi:MAG: hypothetical protein ACK2TV_09115, partial [Anaerolineales bacterium]
MQITKKSSFQFFLLLIAFLLALAFRLIQLGSVPLNNQEANFALQALAVSLGNKTSYGLNMAYVGLTGPDFFVFDATNFLARFWPALFGALAVFIPYLYRQWIGRWPAIALSFILAISPEMVGLSRIIGSPMIAFVCLFLGLGFLLKQKPILSGFLLALSLLSGHSLWIGILIFVVSFLVSERVFNISDIHERHLVDEKRRFWLSWGGAFGVTLILIGTGFFMAPAGLSGIFDGLISFLQGFGTSYTQPYVMLPLTLFAYTMPALILGIWGGIRGVLQHSKVDMFLFLWFILGLILILAYPGSLPADLIWITLPLWILTVRVLISTLKLPDSSRFIIVITLIMVIVVSAFML